MTQSYLKLVQNDSKSSELKWEREVREFDARTNSFIWETWAKLEFIDFIDLEFPQKPRYCIVNKSVYLREPIEKTGSYRPKLKALILYLSRRNCLWRHYVFEGITLLLAR